MKTCVLFPCAIVLALSATTLRGADPKAPVDGVARVFQRFTAAWSSDVWVPQSRSGRPGYMRPGDDAGWQARFRAFRRLVTMGKTALPELRIKLHEGAPVERILAAQAIGFMPARDCANDLADAAQHDKEPAVRLYAIDALSMIDGKARQPLFQRLEKTEKQRDVKRHLGYALERDSTRTGDEVTATLRDWDPHQLDTARVGQPAPDFELASISDQRIRLSDFRAKKAVVLVFVYGDT